MIAVVYRAYDRTGGLLYVGVSTSPALRISGHKSSSEWYHLMREYRVRIYPNEAMAEAVEERAIALLKPKFNRLTYSLKQRRRLMQEAFPAILVREFWRTQANEEGVENITAREALRRLNKADPKAKPIKSVETWNRWRRIGCPGADD